MARKHHTNKVIPEGTTKAVIARLFDDVSGDEGMNAVAFVLGLSMTRAYQLQDEATLTLDHAARLTFITRSPIVAEFMAALAGGQFVPVAPVDEPIGDLVGRIAKESGEVMQAAVALLSDGREKCGVLASEIDDAIRVLIAARRACTPTETK